MASQAKTSMGVSSQRDGAFMNVVIKSDGRVATSCMWISLASCKQCWALQDALKRFLPLDVYIFVTPLRASLQGCVSPLAELSMWSRILVPTALPAGECVQGQKWLTYCGLHLECPRRSFLKLRHTWIQACTVEIVAWMWILCVFVSELDRLTPRRGHSVLGYCKAVKILESLCGTPEIRGQESLKKENKWKEMGWLIILISPHVFCCISMTRSPGFSPLKF